MLCAGAITFLFAWFDKSRKSMPLIFAGTMMVMGGLVVLQFLGGKTPYF
ncbi:MAG: hypothetical protein QNJ07_09435 [Woeseiaceae bacterium]|nr:hypothetical protein [Woeseiaceae bacterium]